MFIRKTLMIAGIVVLVTFSIVALSITTIRGRSIFGTSAMPLIAPVQTIISRSVYLLKDIWNHYFFLVSTAKRNDELKKELAIVLDQDNQCKETALANIRLRYLLEFRKKIGTDQLVVGQVIAKDPSPWFSSLIIDKGLKDGINKGLPVVVYEGIVGVVTEVSHRYSKVQLIVDRNTAVDALVQRSRARGIVKGNGSGACLFNYIPRKHDIEVGDVLVSSGLDGIFPKGLRVGEISVVNKSGTDIFQEVIVEPRTDFEKLEEVIVLLNPAVYEPSKEDNEDE